jgi:hypothetical protein
MGVFFKESCYCHHTADFQADMMDALHVEEFSEFGADGDVDSRSRG